MARLCPPSIFLTKKALVNREALWIWILWTGCVMATEVEVEVLVEEVVLVEEEVVLVEEEVVLVEEEVVLVEEEVDRKSVV